MKNFFIIVCRDTRKDATEIILDLADKKIGSYCFEGDADNLASHLGITTEG